MYCIRNHCHDQHMAPDVVLVKSVRLNCSARSCLWIPRYTLLGYTSMTSSHCTDALLVPIQATHRAVNETVAAMRADHERALGDATNRLRDAEDAARR